MRTRHAIGTSLSHAARSLRNGATTRHGPAGSVDARRPVRAHALKVPDVPVLPPPPDDERRPCLADGCDGPVYARRLCEKHYRRLRRRGVFTDRPAGGDCAVDGCDRPVASRGWCHGHYQRWRRHGDVQAELPLGRRRQPEVCPVEGCGRPTHARGLCRTHLSRLERTGDVQAAVPVQSQDATGSISHGYRRVAVPKDLQWLTAGRRSETEHRLVMALVLGRPLTPDESVHHRNGVRTDNRMENLELWSVSQPSGQRVVDKIAHAEAVLRKYAPERLRDDGGVAPPTGFEPVPPP